MLLGLPIIFMIHAGFSLYVVRTAKGFAKFFLCCLCLQGSESYGFSSTLGARRNTMAMAICFYFDQCLVLLRVISSLSLIFFRL